MVESRRHTVFRPFRLRGKHNPHPGRRCAVIVDMFAPGKDKHQGHDSGHMPEPRFKSKYHLTHHDNINNRTL